MLKKRKNFIIGVAAVVLALIITLPIIIGLVSKPIKDPGSGSSTMKIDTKLEVLESDINWAENAYSLSLNSGKIVTNVPVSRIFVNANGVGTQDLDYTVNEAKNAAGAKVVNYTIKPVKNICSTAFDSDSTVKVDIYVVFDEISYKVNTSNVKVKSCWIGPY